MTYVGIPADKWGQLTDLIDELPDAMMNHLPNYLPIDLAHHLALIDDLTGSDDLTVFMGL